MPACSFFATTHAFTGHFSYVIPKGRFGNARQGLVPINVAVTVLDDNGRFGTVAQGHDGRRRGRREQRQATTVHGTKR